MITTTWYTNDNNSIRAVKTTADTSDPGFAAEFTTEDVVQKVRGCAETSLNAQTTWVAGTASSSFSLASDRSSASGALNRWRIAMYGGTADDEYKIILTWAINENGVETIVAETRETKGSDQPVWYYPSDGGERLDYKDSSACGFTYSKRLLGASVTVK